LYARINCRGVFPVYIHAIWKLVIPPRVQFFLWLLSHNRILTRDNLQKRRDVSDPTCLFCSEQESIRHLFFDCCVAVSVWSLVAEVLGENIGADYESVAKLWVANKKHLVTNVISSAVLWSLWKLRNEICFQGVFWLGTKMVLIRIAKMLRGWFSMFKREIGVLLESRIVRMEELSRRPAQIEWKEEVATDLETMVDSVMQDLESKASQPPRTVGMGE